MKDELFDEWMDQAMKDTINYMSMDWSQVTKQQRNFVEVVENVDMSIYIQDPVEIEYILNLDELERERSWVFDNFGFRPRRPDERTGNPRIDNNNNNL